MSLVVHGTNGLTFNDASLQSSALQAASAWVAVKVTAGVPAIQDSFNISSVTDSGVGSITPNFATTMANANYAIAVATDGAGAGGIPYGGADTKTTSSFRLKTTNAGSFVDNAYSSATVFGGL